MDFISTEKRNIFLCCTDDGVNDRKLGSESDTDYKWHEDVTSDVCWENLQYCQNNALESDEIPEEEFVGSMISKDHWLNGGDYGDGKKRNENVAYVEHEIRDHSEDNSTEEEDDEFEENYPCQKDTYKFLMVDMECASNNIVVKSVFQLASEDTHSAKLMAEATANRKRKYSKNKKVRSPKRREKELDYNAMAHQAKEISMRSCPLGAKCGGIACSGRSTMTAGMIYQKLKCYKEANRQDRTDALANIQIPTPDGLCKECFMEIHGVSRWAYTRGQENGLSDDTLMKRKHAHGNTGRRRMALSSMVMEAWIKDYAKQAGDFMPDSMEIHLPEYSWTMVHELFVREHGMGEGYTYKAFTRIRRMKCSHVKIRKCKKFAACHFCVRLKELIAKKNGKASLFWKAELAAHNAWQLRERMQQAKHVEKATNAKTKHKAMVIMIDNMDHSKTDLPQFPLAGKDLEHSTRLITHMTGVHVPGWKRRTTMCYTWNDQFPTSSDAVITIIQLVLCECQKDGPLPDNLYLHLDNCWRENKNKYVLGIAHMLVERGVFKKVKIAFLPVGHTHNIVDQMFSCFARALKKTMFTTIPELHEICRQSYKQSAGACGKRWEIGKNYVRQKREQCSCEMQFVHMEHVLEMASWGPLLRTYLAKNITGISKPRYFYVKRDEDGVVRHHYRSQLQNTRTQEQMEDNENAGCSPQGTSLACFDKDKETRCLAWMPLNTKGFIVFPNGFPSIENIVNVPKKTLDWIGLEKTRDLICHKTSPESRLWWSLTLKSLQAAEARSKMNVCDVLFPLMKSVV
jgi:hypothetical protein